MSEPVLEIEYHYRAHNEGALDSTLSALQNEIGGQRHPDSLLAGAIDLVTFLELVVTFVAGASLGEALRNYFSGLSGAEGAKDIGERHRAIVLQWLCDARDELARLIASAGLHCRKDIGAPEYGDKEYAIAIRIRIGRVECFIVLNGPHISEDALEHLPDAISRMLRFIAETELPEESTILQLCLDPLSREWRYLLAPSQQAFGSFVDRVLDLWTGQLMMLRTRHEFITLLRVAEKDGIKFIINPYR